MPLFSRRPQGDKPPRQDPAEVARQRREEIIRQERDQELLEGGMLPSGAQHRLTEIGQAGPGTLSFTSDLAADEAGLLRRHGFAPLALVTGSAMYRISYAYASAFHDTEVAELSGAYMEATRLAVERLRMEAKTIGAHGVVGVRYDLVRHEWADGTVEVQVIGTAVSGPTKPTGGPWLSDLSGQEWWALYRAGYEPVTLAYGHCTWFVLTTQSDIWNEGNPQNVELRHFSQALGQCRTRAAGRMRQMARDTGSIGVVGVHVARRLDEVHLAGAEQYGVSEETEHHNLTLSLIGTAIRVRSGAPDKVRGTTMILSLRDGRLQPIESESEAAFE